MRRPARWQRWRGLILAAAAWPAFSAPAQVQPQAVSPALASLEACAAGLDSLDVGYERIAERCPELTAVLEGSPYAPWLPADWKRPGNELSAAGLLQLHALLQREMGTGAPDAVAHLPDVRHLAPVLAQLPPVAVEPSWSERLGRWLRGHAAPGAPHRDTGGGIWAWLMPVAPLPETAGYVLLASVVLLAVLLAARELRLHAVRRSRRTRPAHLPPAPDGRGVPIALPGDVAGGEASEKLGVLLAGVASRLAAQGRLPGARSLTARELIRSAQLPPELVRPLAVLAGVSEQLAYAAVPPGETEIEAAAAQGRQLLAQLEAGS